MRSNAAFLSKLSESVANESSSDDEAPVKAKEKPSLSGKGTKKLTALEKSPLFLKRIAEIAAATEDPSERDMIHTATSSVLKDALLTESLAKADVINSNASSNFTRGKSPSQPQHNSISTTITGDEAGKTSLTFKTSLSSQEIHNNQSPKWQQRKTFETSDLIKSQQPPSPVTSPTSIYTGSSYSRKPSPAPESPKSNGKSLNCPSTLNHKLVETAVKPITLSHNPKFLSSLETQSPRTESPKVNRFVKSSHDKGSIVSPTESPKFIRTQSFDTASHLIKMKTNSYSSGVPTSSQQQMSVDSPKAFHKKMPSETTALVSTTSSPQSFAVKSKILEGQLNKLVRNQLSVPDLGDSSKGPSTYTAQKALGSSKVSSSNSTGFTPKSNDATSARVQAFFSKDTSKSFKFHSPPPSPQGTPNKLDIRKQIPSSDKVSTSLSSLSLSTALKSAENKKTDSNGTTSTTTTTASSPMKSNISKQLSFDNRDREVSHKNSNKNKNIDASSKPNSSRSSLAQNALFLKRQAIVSAAEDMSPTEEDPSTSHIHSPPTNGPVGKSPSPITKGPMGGDTSSTVKATTGCSPSPSGKDKMEKKNSPEDNGTQSNPLYTLSQSSLFLKRVALVNIDQQAVIEEKFSKGLNPSIQQEKKVFNSKMMMNQESLSDDSGKFAKEQTTDTYDSIDSPRSLHEISTPSHNQSSEYFELNSFDVSRSFGDMEKDEVAMDESTRWNQVENPSNETNNISNESIQFNIQYEFGGMKQASSQQGGLLTSRSQYESFFQDDFSRSFDEASIGSYSNAANHKTAFTNDQVWENLFTDLDESTVQDSTRGTQSNTVFMSNHEEMMDPVHSSEESYSPWNMQSSHAGSNDLLESDLVFHTVPSDEKMIRDLRYSGHSLSKFSDDRRPRSQDAIDFDGEVRTENDVVDKQLYDRPNLKDVTYNEQHGIVPHDDSEEHDYNDIIVSRVLGEPKMSLCKPYSVLLSLSSKADIVRISAPTLVSDFLDKAHKKEHRLRDEFSDEYVPSVHKSSVEWNEHIDFGGIESGETSRLSPHNSTETVSQWWENNYAASQGADVNQSVNQALFPKTPNISEPNNLNDTSLFSTKSEEDIFSGIHDVEDSQGSKDIIPTSQFSEPIVNNGENGTSFIPPFASDRKISERREYSKYQGDLMTDTSDITFDIHSRRDRKPLTMKESDSVSGRAYRQALNSSKERMAAQRPVSSTPPDGNLDTSALLSLLAGKITCGALGPLMAAFEDPLSNKKLSGGIGISNSGRKVRRYQSDNEDTTAIMEAASDHDDVSHVGSEISSRVHLSKKEKRVWDSWERRDNENRPKPSAVTPFTNDDSQRPDTMNHDMRRMKHQEKRAVAHEKLLLHAYAALSLLPNHPNAIVNPSPFVGVLNSTNISNNHKQALERFCQGVKSGMAILKLNRDKKWHLRFLTVSQEGSWLNNGDSRSHDSGYYPLGLLWVKKMNKTKGHSITSIDPDGRGGLLLADMVRIEECTADIENKFPLTKRQLRDYPDSVALRLQVDHNGITRFVTFRCSKAASSVIITGCQSAIALLGTYSIRNLTSVNVQK